MILFRLDPSSGVSTYLQLVHQVRHAIQLGVVSEGDQLPTVKEVVAELAINPNTVLKAYRELEHEGLCSGRPGVGTFITHTIAAAPPEVQMALRSELAGWVDRAAAAGFDTETMVGLLRAVAETLDEEDVA